jgi:prepilin-type N-terminal cleavage/methylation domain-containing protein
MAAPSPVADARGMTLVEMLLAIVLAGALLIVGLGWMVDGLAASEDIRKRARWERCARALLQCMHDDVRSGDADAFRFDAPSGAVVLKGATDEVLLGDVEAFEVEGITGEDAVLVRIVGPVTIERRIDTRW